jgi:hypothetical protein
MLLLPPSTQQQQDAHAMAPQGVLSALAHLVRQQQCVGLVLC